MALPSRSVRTAVNMIQGALQDLAPGERAQVLAIVGAVEQEGDDPVKRIQRALDATRGNIKEAAFVLGVSRRHLQDKMRELGMPPGKRGRKDKLA